MNNRIHAIAAVAALATAGMLMTAMPAEAKERTVWLPGVKGYNFKASPSKVRRLCINYWKGRFWYRKPFYGCDGIKFRWRHWRVNCHTLARVCVISHRAPAMGPDGGDRRNRSDDNGRQGGPGKP